MPAGPEGRIILDAKRNTEFTPELIDVECVDVCSRVVITMYVEQIDELIEKLQELRAWQKDDNKGDPSHANT